MHIRVDDIQPPTDNYNLIIGAIESVDYCELFIFKELENVVYERIAWVQVLPFDGEPDETIINYSANEFMDSWEKQFYS